MYSKKPKVLDFHEVLAKLKHYCAYQERCYFDVERKMKEYELTDDEKYEIISSLRIEDYINEERFVRSFCRGKFNVKKWGKNKIKNRLLLKSIPSNLIDKGMTEIDEELYQSALHQLIKSKANSLGNLNNRQVQAKVARFAIQRGFESNLVWAEISTQLKQ